LVVVKLVFCTSKLFKNILKGIGFLKKDKNIILDEQGSLEVACDSEQSAVVDSDTGYTVVLDEYTGPLDLLLTLVKSAKINIADIFVSQVTNQYLEFMSQIDTVDMDKATEFLSIAAILLEIKSKSLLPRIEDDVTTDEEYSKKELVRKLEEYKLFRDASDKLKQIELVGAYERPTSIDVNDSITVLKDMTATRLATALNELFIRLEKKLSTPVSRKIVLDKFTVEDKIKTIKSILSCKKQCCFDELFVGQFDKSEVVTTFQALLELLKNQELAVVQTEIYGKIEISLRQ